MTAGGIPGVQVLLDDGTGAFPYDISSFCRVGYSISRGRQDEQSAVTPGQMSGLVADNTDGRFTIGSTIIATPSPIRLDNNIRLKVTPVGQATVTRHTSHMQELPVSWPTGGDNLSEVTLVATDAQARAIRRILRSVVEEEIIADSPKAYYTLGEPEGATSAADSSGNQSPALAMLGSGADVTFGTATGPGTDGLSAATFAGGKYLTTRLPTALSASWTVECFMSAASAPAANQALFYLVGTPYEVLVTTAGQIFTPSLSSGPIVTDGGIHHVALVYVGGGVNLYVDGVLQDNDSSVGPWALDTFVVGAGYGNPPFVGSISHFTITDASLTAADMLAHYTAGLTGFAGESDTARLTRLAGYASIPLGTLDASLTNVPFEDISGKTANDAVGDVVGAAVGIAYVNGSGALDFHNRNRVVTKTTPDLTLNADVLEDDITFLNDMAAVCNYLTATAATGVNQVVRNTLSELGDGTAANPGHGRYDQSASYLVSTDPEALDRANWIVANHAEPTPRVPSLTINLMMLDAATQYALLQAEPDTWIRFTNCPAQTPGGSTTVDVIVQGWKEDLTEQSWQITFNVVARSLFSPVWILGDTTYSVLGSTTRLYI